MKNIIWLIKCIAVIAFFANAPYRASLLIDDNNIPGIISVILGTVFLLVCAVALLVREYKYHDCDIFQD
jgi:hypothetical protein